MSVVFERTFALFTNKKLNIYLALQTRVFSKFFTIKAFLASVVEREERIIFRQDKQAPAPR